MEIKIFIPSENIKEFTSFANKAKKHINGFDYQIGSPHMELFYHPTINKDGAWDDFTKVFHNVCDVTIIEPEEKDWRLVATYKDNNFLPTNPSKKLVYKNPKHGKDYGVCDACGHKITTKRAYIIENIKTGEELQVGCACINKFGLTSFEHIARFNNKLYELYDYSIKDSDGDIREWRGKKDTSFLDAFETSKLITAAKKVYDKCPIWKRGEVINGRKVPSETSIDIQREVMRIKYENIEIDKKYTKSVCDYTLSQESKNEFQGAMHALAKNYYCNITQTVYAFFMVKAYENSKKNIGDIKVGTPVKVDGKIIQHEYKDGWYGTMQINTILTDNGRECERIGVIPIIPNNDGTDIDKTSFYSVVKFIRNNKIYLDRATKNPKKGVEYIAI